MPQRWNTLTRLDWSFAKAQETSDLSPRLRDGRGGRRVRGERGTGGGRRSMTDAIKVRRALNRCPTKSEGSSNSPMRFLPQGVEILSTGARRRL